MLLNLFRRARNLNRKEPAPEKGECRGVGIIIYLCHLWFYCYSNSFEKMNVASASHNVIWLECCVKFYFFLLYNSNGKDSVLVILVHALLYTAFTLQNLARHLAVNKLYILLKYIY